MASNSKKNLPAPIQAAETEHHIDSTVAARWENAKQEFFPVLVGSDKNNKVYIQENKNLGLALYQTTGFVREESAMQVLTQAVNVVDPHSGNHAEVANIASLMLNEMRPRNAVEGMLCAQMLAVHNASMYAAHQVTHGNSLQQKDKSLKTMEKLSGLFVRQAEALAKLRSGGKQEVKVTHVHQNVQVNDGGQALVTGATGGSTGDGN